MHEDLHHIGLIDEEDIALDLAALSLALLDHTGTDLALYHDLLDAMETRLDLVGGDAEAPAQRADALAAVLAGEFGFAGDAETYATPPMPTSSASSTVVGDCRSACRSSGSRWRVGSAGAPTCSIFQVMSWWWSARRRRR